MHLVGRGSDVKGNGDAEADVRLAVAEHPEGSLLTITTDLNIRGKFVQFGKGAIASVSNKILGQFATNMAALLEQGDAPAAAVAPAGAGSSAASPTTAGLPFGRRGPPGGGRRRRRPPPSRPRRDLRRGCVEGWILTRAFGRRDEHGRAGRPRRVDLATYDRAGWGGSVAARAPRSSSSTSHAASPSPASTPAPTSPTSSPRRSGSPTSPTVRATPSSGPGSSTARPRCAPARSPG